jgi:L-asparaginase
MAPQAQSPLPRIVLITTGGTIGSRIDPETGAVRALETSQELVQSLPQLSDFADVEIDAFITINSWNLRPETMFVLVQRIRDHLRRHDVDGVVVTHGTDSVEETSLMADLLLEIEKPVVFVAAMRNLSEAGPDGPRNLLDAVRVAVDDGAAQQGVLIVVNEQIHSARYVTKSNTVNPQTFRSPEYGPVGQVTGLGVRWLHQIPQRSAIPVERIVTNIPIISAPVGTDAGLLEWCVQQGACGIVLEGSGAGNVPQEMMPGIESARSRGGPVVLTTRVQDGFLSPTYGTGEASGGGFDLVRMGAIPSMYWRSPKARIALMVAVSAGLSEAEMRELFAAP